MKPQGNRERRYSTGPGEAYQMDWGFVNVETGMGEYTGALEEPVWRYENHLSGPEKSVFRLCIHVCGGAAVPEKSYSGTGTPVAIVQLFA